MVLRREEPEPTVFSLELALIFGNAALTKNESLSSPAQSLDNDLPLFKGGKGHLRLNVAVTAAGSGEAGTGSVEC